MRTAVVLSFLALFVIAVSAKNWHSEFHSYVKNFNKNYATVDEYRTRLGNYMVKICLPSTWLSIEQY